MITRTIFGEQYTSLSSSLFSLKLLKIIFYFVVFRVSDTMYSLTFSVTFEKILQQNTFNLTSYSSEILVHGHLSRVVPKLEVLAFTEEKVVSGTGRFQGHVRKALRQYLYINRCGNC